MTTKGIVELEDVIFFIFERFIAVVRRLLVKISVDNIKYCRGRVCLSFVEILIFLDHRLLPKIFIDNEGYVRGIGSVFPFKNKTVVVRRLLAIADIN